jgi:uncharacterized protein YecT (DUF1311 family)
MRIVFTLFVLGLLAALTPAQAASFDCNRARTAVERAVCGDPTLSESDDVLAVAWATAIGGLSEEALAVMRAGQRGWIDYVSVACTADGTVQQADYDEDGAQCLDGLYRNRISDLEASRMLGGKRFYISSRHAAAPDPDAERDSPWRIGTKEFTTLRLDGAAGAGFNAFMDEEDTLFAGLFTPTGEDPDSSGPSQDSVVTIDVQSVTPARITAVVSTYWYGHGAAHGNSSLTYRHFLTDEGRAVEASDVFAGDGWQDVLAELAFARISETLGAEGLLIDGPGDILATVATPTAWSFDDDGLTIQFQQYEVASYAAGMVTATIPWEQLAALEAESASQVIWGY